MKKLFENLLPLTLEHIVMMTVFVFGLGIGWQKIAAESEAIRNQLLTLNAATNARMEGMRAERELKLQMLALQIQSAENRVANLEQERAEQRAVAQRLSSVEAKLGGVEELLRAISRKL